MLLMLHFDDLFACIYKRTSTADLKKLRNLIFELHVKANDKLLLNAPKKKKTFKEKKKKHKKRK